MKRRPSGLNPSCPRWLRDTSLSSRICNVLTAGGIETEEQLRGMLAHRTGQEILRALPNMGRKSMCELREWASATPPVWSEGERRAMTQYAAMLSAELSDVESPRILEVVLRVGIPFSTPAKASNDFDYRPLGCTAAMIDAGAQRLVRWEDGCEWPSSWDALQVMAARNDAERVWRSMWLAYGEGDH